MTRKLLNDEPPLPVWQEAEKHFFIAWPVVVNMICYRLPWMVTLMFVGRLGEVELATAAMATTLANVTGSSILVGLSSAQATLSAQAFGSGDYARVGIVLQQTLLVFGIACFLASLLWAFGIDPFLRATGQDPQIASLTRNYLCWLIPGLFGSSVTFALQRFLQAQGITKPPAVAALITALIHIPVNVVFIPWLGMGLRGAALATSINQMLTPLVLLSIMIDPCSFRFLKEPMKVTSVGTEIVDDAAEKDTFINQGDSRNTEVEGEGKSRDIQLDSFLMCWQGWSVEALNRGAMMDFLRLGGAGLVMIMEWWASEIAILMSGSSDGSQGLSAMSLYQMTNSFCFMVAKGFEVSTSTRVGVALGAAQPKSAQRAATVGPGLAFFESSVLAVLLLLNRSTIPLLFTGTATEAARATAARVTATYPFLAFYIIADATSSCLGGAITGCGRQRYGAIIVLVAYGMVGLPTCALLAFRYKHGYLGIVFGMTLGTFLQCCGNFVITMCTDWDKESIAAVERIKGKNTSLTKESPALFSQGNGDNTDL